MIPFPTYSVKATYLFMFIGFKVYVTVELALVQMLSSPPNALERDFVYGALEEPKKLIPIAIYSFNCIFYARCGLGFTYQSQMPT
jgi:RsiW-degrading membrane proteinase PrsW (M82 family)